MAKLPLSLLASLPAYTQAVAHLSPGQPAGADLKLVAFPFSSGFGA